MLGAVFEPHRHGAAFEPSRPHQRRRHIDVGVRAVDREVGAVHTITEDFVADAHGPLVSRDVPFVRVRAGERERRARRIGRVDVVDVLGELVQRIPARRRSAHPDLEGPRRHVGERDLDLHPVMLGLWKRQPIGDRRLGKRRRGEGDDERDDEPKGRAIHDS